MLGYGALAYCMCFIFNYFFIVEAVCLFDVADYLPTDPLTMSTEKATYQYGDTVYIRDINEKVGLNTLKQKLLELFEAFQPLQVTAHKNLRMKGQAFVTFPDEELAQRALALDGTTLFNKKIEVKLANSSSNESVRKKVSAEEFDRYTEERRRQKEKDSSIVVLNTPPNKILLLQNLPDGITKEELLRVFSKSKGFQDIRLVAVKKVAFVDFATESDAIEAKNENKDLHIRDVKVIVNYAKK